MNLDMTDHCTTDFCIWRTIWLVPVRCISSIRHMYTTDFAYDGPIFLVPLSLSYPSSPVCWLEEEIDKGVQITTKQILYVNKILFFNRHGNGSIVYHPRMKSDDIFNILPAVAWQQPSSITLHRIRNRHLYLDQLASEGDLSPECVIN